MAHDSRGAPLKKGDHVLVEGILQDDPSADGGYCNAYVKFLTPEQNQGGEDSKPPMTPPGDTFNTRMLTKVGAALLLFACVAFYPYAAGQEPAKPPVLADKFEVDRAETLRRGANVTVAGEGPRQSDELLFSMAMSPPAIDSDQFHVTLFGPSNDPATLALYQAFQKDEALTRFTAAPPDGRRAWAHFNWYRSDDRTQKFRLDEFQAASGPFPIVVVQPPRDGSFGGVVPAKTVEGKDTTRQVVIDRIDGEKDAKAIGRRISSSVKLWCTKLAKSGFVPPAKLVARYNDGERVALGPQSEGPTQQPPFTVPPPTVPFNPIFPPGGPAVDPTPAPAPAPNGAALLQLILQFFPDVKTLLLFLTAISNLWLLYREVATAAGVKLLIDDATFQKLKNLINQLSGGGQSPS